MTKQPIFSRNIVVTRPNGDKVPATITITAGFSETNKYAVNFQDRDGGFTNHYKWYKDACARVDELIAPGYVEVK